MTFKQLKKRNKNLISIINSQAKWIKELHQMNETSEKHLQMTEDALAKEWVIISYLEDRQVKLIQAMAE